MYLSDELFKVLDSAGVDGLCRRLRQWRVVVVEKFLAVERYQPLKDTVTDASSADRADDLALQIKCIAGDVRHLPVTTLDHLEGEW